MSATNYYLLIFDVDASRMLDIEEFGTDFDAANDRYVHWEQEGRKRDTGRLLEVVLLGAASLDVIRRTHSNYFDEDSGDDSTAAQFQRLLASALNASDG